MADLVEELAAAANKPQPPPAPDLDTVYNAFEEPDADLRPSKRPCRDAIPEIDCQTAHPRASASGPAACANGPICSFRTEFPNWAFFM